jgi:hypothetical protein
MTSIEKLAPEFNLIASAFSLAALNRPVATFPHPQIPTLRIFIIFP